MARVVISGEGTYGVAGHIFPAGVHEVDDPVVLDAIYTDAYRQDWVELEGYKPEPVSEPEPPAEEAAPDPTPAAETQPLPPEAIVEEEHKAEVEAARKPPAVTKEDLTGPWPCREEECEKIFTSSNGRATHERIKHPDLKAE